MDRSTYWTRWQRAADELASTSPEPLVIVVCSECQRARRAETIGTVHHLNGIGDVYSSWSTPSNRNPTEAELEVERAAKADGHRLTATKNGTIVLLSTDVPTSFDDLIFGPDPLPRPDAVCDRHGVAILDIEELRALAALPQRRRPRCVVVDCADV